MLHDAKQCDVVADNPEFGLNRISSVPDYEFTTRGISSSQKQLDKPTADIGPRYWTLQSRLESIAQAGVNGGQIAGDELNDLVYQLYGLSNRETGLIKDWFERRSFIASSGNSR